VKKTKNGQTTKYINQYQKIVLGNVVTYYWLCGKLIATVR
jgi:hypothetical protein